MKLLAERTQEMGGGYTYHNLAAPLSMLNEYFGREIDSKLPEAYRGETGSIEQLKYVIEYAQSMQKASEAFNEKAFDFYLFMEQYYRDEFSTLAERLPMEGFKDIALGI